ncbi:hypothetical protein AC579_4081 [Pseudocercospora musae]|uniref:Uncharacterized protein n=1 Tax=Pseudocercospora musae TaxID=113226 RepID=A0A139IJX6_9PEZI|nr:hypothetical protein AC579_4081 [Pseudocercospora musae]
MTSDAPFHPAYRHSFEPQNSETSLPSYKATEEATATGDARPMYPINAFHSSRSHGYDLEGGPRPPPKAQPYPVATELKPPVKDQTAIPKDIASTLESEDPSNAVAFAVWLVAFAIIYVINIIQGPAELKSNCDPSPKGNETVRVRCTRENYTLLFLWALCVFKAADSTLRLVIRSSTKGPNSAARMFFMFLLPAVSAGIAVGAFVWMGMWPRCWAKDGCMEKVPDTSFHGYHYGDPMKGTFGMERLNSSVGS